jgi:hypothetical protein
MIVAQTGAALVVTKQASATANSDCFWLSVTPILRPYRHNDRCNDEPNQMVGAGDQENLHWIGVRG